GVLRLLKAIRHDAPDIEAVRKRLGVPEGTDAIFQIMKTIYTAHGGKLSLGRVLSGKITDGVELFGPGGMAAKASGIYRMLGKDQAKQTSAETGDTVALGKLDGVRTGHTLTSVRTGMEALVDMQPQQPVYAMALRPKERKDDVKMSAALQRLSEEDPSLGL